MITGGHFRDLASIHHFHSKAAIFGFCSSRCKSTSGFLNCPASIIAVRSSSRDERHVSPLKHQQKTVRALQAHRAVPDSDFARSLVQAEAADNIDGFT